MSASYDSREQWILARLTRIRPVVRFFHALGFYVGAVVHAVHLGYRDATE